MILVHVILFEGRPDNVRKAWVVMWTNINADQNPETIRDKERMHCDRTDK